MYRANAFRQLLNSILAATIPCLGCHGPATPNPPHVRPQGGPEPTEGETPALHLAIASGDNNLIAHLIANGVDVNERDTISQTPLMVASDRKNVSAVELLLKQGANPKQTNRSGETALHYAVMTGASITGAITEA